MRFALEGETGFGDGGIEPRHSLPYMSYLAVQGPTPEEEARSYVLVPYAGTESEKDLPTRVQESNSFLVNLEA